MQEKIDKNTWTARIINNTISIIDGSKWRQFTEVQIIKLKLKHFCVITKKAVILKAAGIWKKEDKKDNKR